MYRVISPNVINRLPKYLQCLRNLEEKDHTRISSAQIADILGTTASQVRQDLSMFGSYGAQGYGYNVSALANEIEKIMGINIPHNLVIVGVGCIGKALLEHMDFAKHNYRVIAAFDVDENLIGKTINGIQIYSFDDFRSITQNNPVDICMLTVSRESARFAAQQLYGYNVPAIWNFTGEDLKLNDLDIIVRDVNLFDSLFTLTYYYEMIK